MNVRPSSMLAALVASAVLAFTGCAGAALLPGAKAPPFTIQAAKDGAIFAFISPAELEKGPIVIFFYPKSFLTICTSDAAQYAEAMPGFDAAGAIVIGISGDTIGIQRDYSAMPCRKSFTAGADPDLAVSKSFSAALTFPNTQMGVANRVSYVIAPDGTILSSLVAHDVAPHIAAALATVRAWRAVHKAQPKAPAVPAGGAAVDTF